MTPGTAPAKIGTVLPNSPFPVELAGVMMRSALIALSTLLVAELDSEAPNTAMADTSASPTISAAAVWAVRRGLRMEFSRPNRPEVPSSRASGRPMTLAIGRATAGASMATPTKIRTAPRPTSWMAGFVSPTASSTMPIAVMTPPWVKRRRIGTSCSVCCSETAATGAMRTARRAGLMAATSVTPTPTIRQTTTVRAWKTKEPDGSVNPKALSSFSSPRAASTPSPSPITDATSPTITASPSTERNTWRRLAPTMRSSASSRVRWPTVMENVFRMVKPPTNSAMKPKTSSAVSKMPRAWPTALDCSLMTVWPRHHLDAVGQDAGDGTLDGRLVRSRLGDDVDVVELAHVTEERLRGRHVEGGQRRPEQVVRRPEAHEAADGEGAGRAPQEDAHLLAHREVVLLGRAEVHGHLVRPRRCLALHDVEGGDLRVGVELDPDGGCPTGRDGLAVGEDVLRVAGHRAVGGLHARHALHLGEERLGDGIARGGAAAAELGHAAHLEVDVLVDVPEQVVERAVQRVGQHERPGDERHPEHDGEASQHQPELVGQQPLDGDPPHVRRRPSCGCVRAPSPASGRRARRRPCRQRGRRPGRRRTHHGGRGSP